MPLDFMASQPHYATHLAPIWGALGESSRGQFVGLSQETTDCLRKLGIPASTSFIDRTRPIVLAGFRDVGKAERQQRTAIALTEHGAGQSYGGDPKSADHPCYAGGRRRESVSLFLHPGPHPAARERAAYPKARVEEVGSPFLDTLPLRVPDHANPFTVAVSFRWDAGVCPETTSGYADFRAAVLDMAQEERWKVIAHAHPRWGYIIKPWFENNGIEFVDDFMDVCRRADVYVADNSSTIFEFASTNRPVVLMNPPAYRWGVDHGLRFWSASHIGPTVRVGDKLADAVETALEGSPWLRESALSQVYSRRTGAAQQAAEALIDWSSEQ